MASNLPHFLLFSVWLSYLVVCSLHNHCRSVLFSSILGTRSLGLEGQEARS